MSGDETRLRDGYWQQWAAPPTVIAIVVAVVTMYGSWIVQQERLEVLRMRIDEVARDYQRKESLAVELRNITERLYSIEQKIDGRSPLLR